MPWPRPLTAARVPSAGNLALHELRERGLDPELINHLRRLPFPEEDRSAVLDAVYPPIVELDEDEYEGDKQAEDKDHE
jgi:hypothetical protein